MIKDKNSLALPGREGAGLCVLFLNYLDLKIIIRPVWYIWETAYYEALQMASCHASLLLKTLEELPQFSLFKIVIKFGNRDSIIWSNCHIMLNDTIYSSISRLVCLFLATVKPQLFTRTYTTMYPYIRNLHFLSSSSLPLPLLQPFWLPGCPLSTSISFIPQALCLADTWYL